MKKALLVVAFALALAGCPPVGGVDAGPACHIMSDGVDRIDNTVQSPLECRNMNGTWQ